jgi:hypothetical protein
MAAREEGDQHLLDDVILTDNDLAELREDAFAACGDPFGSRHNDVHSASTQLRQCVNA